MVDKRVLINFSGAQHEAIAEAANKSALSFSAFVRMSSVVAATKAGVEVAKPETTDAENIQVVE